MNHRMTLRKVRQMSLEEKDIDAFIMLMKNGNVTRTADALFMSQSTLTKRIQKLEKEYDCTLFSPLEEGHDPDTCGRGNSAGSDPNAYTRRKSPRSGIDLWRACRRHAFSRCVRQFRPLRSSENSQKIYHALSECASVDPDRPEHRIISEAPRWQIAAYRRTRSVSMEGG